MKCIYGLTENCPIFVNTDILNHYSEEAKSRYIAEHANNVCTPCPIRQAAIKQAMQRSQAR